MSQTSDHSSDRLDLEFEPGAEWGRLSIQWSFHTFHSRRSKPVPAWFSTFTTRPVLVNYSLTTERYTQGGISDEMQVAKLANTSLFV